MGVTGGKRVLPEGWIRASWTPKTHDRHDEGYGYGWFISEAHGHPIYYACGFGGQMLYVIPSLKLTIVIASDSTAPFVETDYHCALQTLVADGFIPAAMGGPLKARHRRLRSTAAPSCPVSRPDHPIA